jgi:hypothetical protein
MIAAGRQPPELTAEALAERIDLPPRWTDQEEAVGFCQATGRSTEMDRHASWRANQSVAMRYFLAWRSAVLDRLQIGDRLGDSHGPRSLDLGADVDEVGDRNAAGSPALCRVPPSPLFRLRLGFRSHLLLLPRLKRLKMSQKPSLPQSLESVQLV